MTTNDQEKPESLRDMFLRMSFPTLEKWQQLENEFTKQVLARQPKSAPLDDATVERIAKTAHDKNFSCSHFDSDNATEMAIIEGVRMGYAAHPGATNAPAYFVTAERKPTLKDATQEGEVLAYSARDGKWDFLHYLTVCDYPDRYQAWQPLPPAPEPKQTPEDAAFEDALIGAGFGSSTYDDAGKLNLRRLFNAGQRFGTKGGN